ncbi:MAG: nucleotidyltransferase domain-containing protein [Gammaproteobacteria bacterium]|nr:nucleotidyltransferase domain-containing protein [Gammaproteobacteria bacterium]
MDATTPEPNLIRRLAEVLDPREEILEAYLFGSHARGLAQPHSDVDVAVYIDYARADDTGFGYRANLTTDLIAGLGCNDVDVVVLNRAPPLLYHRVLRDGVRLLARDLCATTTREGRAVSRYCDFVPQLEKMEAARRSAAARGP